MTTKKSAKVFIVSVIGLSAANAAAAPAHKYAVTQYPNGLMTETIDDATYYPDGTVTYGQTDDGQPKLQKAQLLFYSDGTSGFQYGDLLFYSNGTSGFSF